MRGGNGLMWLVKNLIECGTPESLVKMNSGAEITGRLRRFGLQFRRQRAIHISRCNAHAQITHLVAIWIPLPRGRAEVVMLSIRWPAVKQPESFRTCRKQGSTDRGLWLPRP